MCGQPAGQSPFGMMGVNGQSGGMGMVPGGQFTPQGAPQAYPYQPNGLPPQAMQSLQQPGMRGGNVMQSLPPQAQGTPPPFMGQAPRQAQGPMPPMGQPMSDPMSAGGNFGNGLAQYIARLRGGQ